jgi:putative pyruvate formate lyase activating enzyme
MRDLYKSCELCPRKCGVNRLSGEAGYCGETAALRVAAALLHFGEEPPLVGTGGSGTIFISGCNLGCAFCQNYQISHGESGAGALGHNATLGCAVSAEDFASICAALRDKGAANINIVTGSHAIPAIVEGITAARRAGVNLPVLWNSSAYESPQALELLRDHVEIYLPDLKTLDSGIAAKFFNAPDYPQAAAAAIIKMADMAAQATPAAYATQTAHATQMREKVIVRHLILPGCLESTRGVLRWFAQNVKNCAMLSLMTQYTPAGGKAEMLNDIPKRFLSREEYDTVMEYLEEFEIENGFCQELVTGSDWLPDFTRPNPFSSELSVPVWHFTSQT